jgi:hypothetical protein
MQIFTPLNFHILASAVLMAILPIAIAFSKTEHKVLHKVLIFLCTILLMVIIGLGVILDEEIKSHGILAYIFLSFWIIQLIVGLLKFYFPKEELMNLHRYVAYIVCATLIFAFCSGIETIVQNTNSFGLLYLFMIPAIHHERGTAIYIFIASICYFIFNVAMKLILKKEIVPEIQQDAMISFVFQVCSMIMWIGSNHKFGIFLLLGLSIILSNPWSFWSLASCFILYSEDIELQPF